MAFDGRDGRDGQGGWNAPDGQDEQRRRLAALRNLSRQSDARQQAARDARASAAPGLDETAPRLRVATSNRSPQPRPQLLPQPPQRGGAWRLGVVALVIVALAAGAGLWIIKGGQRPSGAASKPPVMPPINTIDLGAYNLSCPKDLAWSPDGTRIALWATLGDCGNDQTGGPELAIFDTRTGKLVDSVTLYSLLAKQSLPQKLIPSPAAWSPDSASLSFSVGYTYYQPPASGAPHGLVTITLAHHAVRYTADPTPLPVTMDGAMRIWDITSGKLVHSFAELAPATVYTWGADGSLAPSDAGAAGKGAASVWQAGDIYPVDAIAGNENVVGPPDEYVPQEWLYNSDIPRWSPNGRYLALSVSLGVRLPGGAHAFPVSGCSPQLCDSAPVAPPDKGFSAALAAAQKGWIVGSGQPPQWYSLDIAWRADGQELATMLPNEDYHLGEPVAKVTIFNTQTGALVAKLPITRSEVNLGGSPDTQPQIVWSPRGASLAALDYADATLTLWRAE